MSELINNNEKRRKELKEIIQKLHDGHDFDQVQAEFTAKFGSVTAAEITALEQELIKEGMDPREIQRLCDVHAAVFKGSIEEIHNPVDLTDLPGHPVQVMKQENAVLENLYSGSLATHLINFSENPDQKAKALLQTDLELALQIDRHYSRKENLIFPYLEKHGITAPPKVMWGVDDEIRFLFKDARKKLTAWPDEDASEIVKTINEAVSRAREMIYKEEHILFPMALENFSEAEWRQIAADSPDIGYCLITDVPGWPGAAGSSEQDVFPGAEALAGQTGLINLPTGNFNVSELAALLNTLPLDITFVDKDDTVRYFSQGKERIFDRARSVIGRKVVNCHPPASVHIVERIVSDFKSGIRENADFWIRMGPRYVLIRYFAVRDSSGEYLGTLEVTQDIAPIQAIEGEKRLLD